MTIADRDLLAYEPNLFRDVAWAAQTLISGVATTSGMVLSVTSTPTLEERQVEAGMVAVIEGLPLEIIERTGATEAWASLPRASADAPPLTPPPYSGAVVYIATFRPQIELVHRRVLRLVGIDPDDADSPGEAAIANPSALTRLEALAVLAEIYSAAAASSGSASPLRDRAEMYRRRADAEKARVEVRIDLDGDGVAETVRRPALATFSRG